MARPSDGAGAEAAATWEEIMDEAIIKHERSSERQLYVYGISVNRCPQCRLRIKSNSKQCEACRFTHNVQRACRRCTDEAIEMWCYECDAYYCDRCYNRSHLLSRSGSGAQHSCFPIEGGSGKAFVKGSWNQDLTAIVQSTYRLRISERLAAGAIAPPAASAIAQTTEASSRPVETAQEVEVGNHPTLVETTASNDSTQTSTPSEGTTTTPDEIEAAATASTLTVPSADSAFEQNQQDGGSKSVHTTPVSSSASASASPGDADASPPAATTSSESRKRQLGGDGNDVPSETKHQRTELHKDPPAHQQGSQTAVASPPSSARLSLYEQVRLMHERRQKKAALPPRPHPPQQQQQQQQQEQQQQTSQTPVTQQHPPLYEQQGDEHHTSAQPSAPEHPTPPAPLTTPEAEESPSPLVPSTSSLAAEHQQRIVHELEQRQRRLQRAVSDSSLSSTSTAPPIQGMNGPRPPNQAAYPVQHVQSPLPSPLPSPSASAGLQQHFGGTGMGLPTAPPHVSAAQPTGAVGFLRPSAMASQPFQPAAAAMIDLTGPVVPSRAQLQPHAIGSNPPIAFQSPAGAAPSAGDLTDEDALLSAVLADFNSINAHVMELENKIQSMMSAVRMFSFQDVAKAATLNVKIAKHRGVLEKARARRIQVSARVMMYLPAVSEFARSADRGSWGDVPRVLTTCQTRLAQLAVDMTGCEQRVLQLRGLIDDAVSSNDVRRIMQVQELGDQLKQEESRFDALKTERDSQFVLMIKFSRELREAVQQEVAALSRNAAAAAASASSA